MYETKSSGSGWISCFGAIPRYGVSQIVEFKPGRAAHDTHNGSYANLHVTYRMLTLWCLQERVLLNGESWEICGDWNDDPSKLKTDLYLGLRNDA